MLSAEVSRWGIVERGWGLARLPRIAVTTPPLFFCVQVHEGCGTFETSQPVIWGGGLHLALVPHCRVVDVKTMPHGWLLIAARRGLTPSMLGTTSTNLWLCWMGPLDVQRLPIAHTERGVSPPAVCSTGQCLHATPHSIAQPVVPLGATPTMRAIQDSTKPQTILSALKVRSPSAFHVHFPSLFPVLLRLS